MLPVHSFAATNLCCGDAKVQWGGHDSRYSGSFTLGYIKQSEVTNGLIDATKLTIVANDVSNTSQVIPGLLAGVPYFIVVLPTNGYGYSLDVEGGIPTLNAPSSGSSYVYTLTLQGCTSANDCAYPVSPSWITQTDYYSTQVLSGIFSGSNISASPKCSATSISGDAWFIDGLNPDRVFTAEIAFPTPIDISSIKVFQGGITPNQVFTGMDIEVQTCNCTTWKPYAYHRNTVPFSWTTHANTRGRVTKIRFRKGAVNINSVLICATQSTCLEPAYAKTLETEVDAIAETSARVTWTPATDRAAGITAPAYEIALSTAIAKDGSLISPKAYAVTASRGSESMLALDGLTPGTTYYGAAVPTNCEAETEPPSAKGGIATTNTYKYSTTDVASFKFTTRKASKATTEKLGLRMPSIAATERPALESYVFPNPVTNTLTTSASEPISEFTIHDLQGRQISRISGGDQLTIVTDVSHLPAGMYTVTLTTATSSATHLVVVAR